MTVISYLKIAKKQGLTKPAIVSTEQEKLLKSLIDFKCEGEKRKRMSFDGLVREAKN